MTAEQACVELDELLERSSSLAGVLDGIPVASIALTFGGFSVLCEGEAGRGVPGRFFAAVGAGCRVVFGGLQVWFSTNTGFGLEEADGVGERNGALEVLGALFSDFGLVAHVFGFASGDEGVDGFDILGRVVVEREDVVSESVHLVLMCEIGADSELGGM